MTVISITRDAKCKDCKFLFRYNIGKMVRHRCSNPDSDEFEKSRTMNELVCNDWKL